MQPLVTIRRLMTWLCMCSVDESSNSRPKKAFIVAHTLFVLTLNLIGFLAPIAFCLKYSSIDFNGTTFAFMIIIAEFGVIYFLIIAILMRHHIDSVFTSLSAIYKSSKFNSEWIVPSQSFFQGDAFNGQFTDENEVTFRYLVRVNNISEWMLKIYLAFMKISICGCTATSIFSVVNCYLTRGELDVDHLYRPSKYV